MEKLFNNYGAAISASEFVAMFGDEKAFKEAVAVNSLAVRAYVLGRGFNRVSRAFADELIKRAA